jgi:hypothetical protein
LISLSDLVSFFYGWCCLALSLKLILAADPALVLVAKPATSDSVLSGQ